MIKRIRRKLYKLFHPPLGEVLMLHRVIPERSILSANRELEVTPDFLEKTIQKYIAEGRPIISLDEVHEIVQRKKKLKKPFVCFTLDDGYRDNYDYAYPIFKKYNCPFAVYVPTGFLEREGMLWWYEMADILMENTSIKLTDGKVYSSTNIVEKQHAFWEIRERISHETGSNCNELFRSLFSEYKGSSKFELEQYILTKEQVQELSNDPLCTIAAHGVSHDYLTNMSATQQHTEIADSKNKLEGIIGQNVLHFAYPYGKYNDETIRIVSDLGFRTAVLAVGGKVRLNESVYKINRRILFENE